MMIRIEQTARFVAACILAFIGLALGGPAAAQSNFTPGFYVSGFGGGSVLTDQAFRSGGAKFDVDFDTGFAVGAAAGYRFAKNFRMETEFTYRQHNVGDVGSAGVPATNVGGDVSAWSGMMNGILDFGDGTLVPYVGAGLGFANVDIDNATATIAAGKVNVDDSDTVLAFQAMAGLTHELTQEWNVTGEYRFFGTNSISALGTPDDFEYQSHNFSIGARYDF